MPVMTTNGKKTYFCVVMQVYEYGAVKLGIHTRVCKEIPTNKEKSVYGVTTYEDWFDNRDQAEAFLAKAQAEAAAA